jgi:Fe-S-cluster formation regulator IscX/YfhJ
MANKLIDLTQFDDDFQSETPAERSDMESVPDGKYQVVVEKVEIAEAHTTGNPMLKWTLRVLAPRYVNRLMWRNSVFTPNTLKFVKTDLHICGLDLEKLSDLPRNLSKLLDVKLEVTKKTKGDNENIFFNRRIDNDRAPGNFRQEAGDALVPF